MDRKRSYCTRIAISMVLTLTMLNDHDTADGIRRKQ